MGRSAYSGGVDVVNHPYKLLHLIVTKMEREMIESGKGCINPMLSSYISSKFLVYRL